MFPAHSENETEPVYVYDNVIILMLTPCCYVMNTGWRKLLRCKLLYRCSCLKEATMRSLFPKLCIAAFLLLAGQVTHTEAQCKQSVYVCDIL